jgi:2-polyprenyl-3-methyl-5-hydroxy-6-metoxy-1,4-benzoquinol methylase
MESSTATYFDQRSAEWDELYQRDPRFARRFDLLTGFIGPLLSKHHIKRALDYGCGSGIFSRYLASHGIEVVGLDISEQMLRRARELSDGSIIFTNDLTQVTAARFDAILALSVLEYVEHVDELLRAFASSTNQNGLLVASIPNPTGVVRRMESMVFGIRNLTRGRLFGSRGDYLAHLRWKITPKQFDQLMYSLGYEKLGELYYNSAFNMPQGILPIFEKRWWAALYAGAYRKVR